MDKPEIAPCMGIPVIYRERAPYACYTIFLWPFQRIVVSRDFMRLSPRQKMALLLHEVGHCKGHHLFWRLIMFWRFVFSPAKLLAYCQEQEFEADRFAAERGFGADLIALYRQMKDPESWELRLFHPTFRDRVARIEQFHRAHARGA